MSPSSMSLAAAAALVAAFPTPSRAQAAVDLRRPALAEPEPHAAPVEFPEPELRPAAARAVLDELAGKLRYLKAEARFLAADARSLWACWSSAFAAAETSPRVQRLRAETFAFYGNALRLEEGLAAHDEALRESARLWAGIGRSDPERLRADIAGLARRVNGLDAEIRLRQADLDRLYPRLASAFAKHAPQAAAPARPWHWAYYMDANRRRPELSVDFETLYREKLDEMHGQR